MRLVYNHNSVPIFGWKVGSICQEDGLACSVVTLCVALDVEQHKCIGPSSIGCVDTWRWTVDVSMTILIFDLVSAELQECLGGFLNLLL